MIYTLVDATMSDIDRLKWYKLNSIFKYAFNLSSKEEAKIRSYVNNSIPNQLNFYKMIVVDGEKIGCLSIMKQADGILLDEIYIEEEYRNKGIGSAIIKHILNENYLVYLWVYKLNNRAISLYKKMGFVITEETETRYYMRYKK